VELVLKCVDDHVGGTFGPLADEGLGDRQSGTPVRKADLDDDSCVLGEQEVPDHIPIALRDGNTTEVTFGTDVPGTAFRQLAAHTPNALEQRRVSGHASSILDESANSARLLLGPCGASSRRWRAVSRTVLGLPLHRPDVHEQRQLGPALVAAVRGRPWFTDQFDGEASVVEREGVILEGVRPASEGHA
jgi:hypothetical protein